MVLLQFSIQMLQLTIREVELRELQAVFLTHAFEVMLIKSPFAIQFAAREIVVLYEKLPQQVSDALLHNEFPLVLTLLFNQKLAYVEAF